MRVIRDIILLSEVAEPLPIKADSSATFDYRVRETVPMMLSEVHEFSNVSQTEKTYE